MMVVSRVPAWLRRVWLLAWCALAAASPAVVDDPVVHAVKTLDAALTKSMRAGAGETSSDRYRMLEPVIDDVFDLPLMTRLSVGAAWTTFSADQQRAVLAAFARLTIAGYAHNFRDNGAVTFEIDDAVVTRGEDRIIQTHLRTGNDASATLVYRVRRSGAGWKIIDVYYDGVSQLTMRRSDFGAAIASGGATALVAHLNALSDDFMKP
jgi:phospholipid transport system substrate-binding protein